MSENQGKQANCKPLAYLDQFLLRGGIKATTEGEFQMSSCFLVSLCQNLSKLEHLLTLGVHAQRGLGYYLVCLSVCLSTRALALQATRRPMSGTNGL